MQTLIFTVVKKIINIALLGFIWPHDWLYHWLTVLTLLALFWLTVSALLALLLTYSFCPIGFYHWLGVLAIYALNPWLLFGPTGFIIDLQFLPYWLFYWLTVFALLVLSLTYCFCPIGFIIDLLFWPCWLPCWGPHSRDAEDLCLLEGRSNISHNLGFSEPATTIKYFNQHRKLTSCPNITIPSKIGSNSKSHMKIM